MPYSINLDHPHAQGIQSTRLATNTLRVKDDQPISNTRDGRILSRYGDDTWDLTPYAFRVLRLSFRYAGASGAESVRYANKLLFKRVMFWLLYGTGLTLSIRTVQHLHSTYRTIYKFCIDNNVIASELCVNPQMQTRLVAAINPYQRRVAVSLIRKMYVDRDLLGFYILSPTNANMLSALSRKVQFSQTPCIPERVFFYVVQRCSDIVDKYILNEMSIRQLYDYCASASIRMRQELGSTAKYARVYQSGSSSTRRNIGALEHFSGKQFEAWLDDLQLREPITNLISPASLGPRTLGAYLTCVALASRILVCALSGMREQEHRTLERDCHEVRDDSLLGPVHLIRGRTTKTLQQRTAYWVSCSLAETAISAARSISTLRAEYAEKFRELNAHGGAIKTNLLFDRSSDPWFGAMHHAYAANVNPDATKAGGLSNLLESAENQLFDPIQMTITKSDLHQALRLSPDLNREKFLVGKPWPLAWHQFRRTLVCLALGSGVSLPAMAWQLKHAGPAMTMYYGNNYFDLPQDKALGEAFANAQLDMLCIKGGELTSDAYFPTIQGHTHPLIRVLNVADTKTMRKLAREGKVSIRDTAIGVCTNLDPCSYGGWEHITECIECVHALASTRNKGRLTNMADIIDADIAACAKEDVLLKESLEAQRNAVNTALSIIDRASQQNA